MRLLVVGGSAHSTPHLFAALPARTAGSPFEVTLAGRSEERLGAVRDAIETVSAIPCDVALTTLAAHDLRAAADNADVVLIQARVGGYAARAHDETFPLAFGMCGDEGLGPGGLAAAWRTWPFLREVLQAIEEAGSSPLILLLTSPLGLLVRCAKSAFPAANIVGICELPAVTLRDAIERTGADPARTLFEYAGVNHLGWFTSLTDGTRNLIRAFAATRDSRIFPTADSIAASDGLPLKYLRLHYEPESVVREQRSAPPRATELESLQERAFEIYRTRDRAAIFAALARRPAPWYGEAIVHVLAPADDSRAEKTVFLTTGNEGYLPWLAAGDVVEIPHAVAAGGFKRAEPVTRASDHVRDTLGALVRYEAAAASAVGARDHGALGRALALHPWVGNPTTAFGLAARIDQPHHAVAVISRE